MWSEKGGLIVSISNSRFRRRGSMDEYGTELRNSEKGGLIKGSLIVLISNSRFAYLSK